MDDSFYYKYGGIFSLDSLSDDAVDRRKLGLDWIVHLVRHATEGQLQRFYFHEIYWENSSGHQDGECNACMPYNVQAIPYPLTSPTFQAVSISKIMRHKGRDLQHVVSPHSGGQQWLMGIPESCICQQKSVALTNTAGKTFRTLLQ